MADEPIDNRVHQWERNGLGRAPFRFMGLVEKVCTGQPGADGMTIVGYAGQPAGTCAYCGQGIRYCCQIRSADGNRFTVGLDCVRGLDGPDKDAALLSAVERADKVLKAKQRKAAKALRLPVELARIERARTILEEKRGALSALPHPKLKDRTLADYLDFLSQHAGHSGLLRMARMVEKA